jgi:hypothetical protein
VSGFNFFPDFFDEGRFLWTILFEDKAQPFKYGCVLHLRGILKEQIQICIFRPQVTIQNIHRRSNAAHNHRIVKFINNCSGWIGHVDFMILDPDALAPKDTLRFDRFYSEIRALIIQLPSRHFP